MAKKFLFLIFAAVLIFHLFSVAALTDEQRISNNQQVNSAYNLTSNSSPGDSQTSPLPNAAAQIKFSPGNLSDMILIFGAWLCVGMIVWAWIFLPGEEGGTRTSLDRI